MKLSQIVTWLDGLLEIDIIEDISLNGLQVGDVNADIQKVAYAVDSGMQIFEQAAIANAQLLFVHHGLFWGKPLAVTRAHYDRVKFLMEHGIALYAAHLPLDKHSQLGNNTGIVQALALEEVKPFGTYHGQEIGWQGQFKDVTNLDAVVKQLGLIQEDVVTWDFGVKDILTVAIISGDAPNEVRQAIDAGIDLYITGETSHALYHECKEAKINVLFAGHYNTEIFGPRLVAEKISKDLGLETEFINVPTSL